MNESHDMPDGYCYGINPVTGNKIFHDRLKHYNPHIIISGVPGSGRTTIAKAEIEHILNTKPDAAVYVIDTKGEYVDMCKAHGGYVIRISGYPEDTEKLNPFAFYPHPYIDKDTQVIERVCDIEALCKMFYPMSGTCTNDIINAIDKAANTLCDAANKPYEEGKAVIEPENAPTMRVMCDLLHNSDDMNINMAADHIHRSVMLHPVLSGNTSVDRSRCHSGMVVYDLSGCASSPHPTDVEKAVCLMDIKNLMSFNEGQRRYSYVYIDDMDSLLFSSASRILTTMWKTSRKLCGAVTGIIGDTKRHLNNPESMAVIENASYVFMLNQDLDSDREAKSYIASTFLHDPNRAADWESCSHPGKGYIFGNGDLMPAWFTGTGNANVPENIPGGCITDAPLPPSAEEPPRISDNKLFHMRRVAEECYRLAKEKGLDEDEARAAYVMGFVHDIGYAFSTSTKGHAALGEKMLRYAFTQPSDPEWRKSVDRKDSADVFRAIGTHGKPYEIRDIYSLILNDADMHVSHTGTLVTSSERLKGIEERYGSSSEEYLNALKMAIAINMPPEVYKDEYAKISYIDTGKDDSLS